MSKFFTSILLLFLVLSQNTIAHALEIRSITAGTTIELATSSRPGAEEDVQNTGIGQWIAESASYWSLLAVDIDPAKKYTVTLKYPADGINRTIGFASPDGRDYRAVSFQVKTEKEAELWDCTALMSRWNVSFSPESTVSQMVIYYTAMEAETPLVLTVEEAVISDREISARHALPTCANAPELYWGDVIENLTLTGERFITGNETQKIDETLVAGTGRACKRIPVNTGHPVDIRLAFDIAEGDLGRAMDFYLLLETGGTWMAIGSSGATYSITPLVSGYWQKSHMELFDLHSLDFSEWTGRELAIYAGYIIRDNGPDAIRYDCRVLVFGK